MKVLCLLIHRIQFQQSFTEKPGLSQSSQFIIRICNIVNTLVCLETIIDQSYYNAPQTQTYLQKSQWIFPIQTYLCFVPKHKRNWMQPRDHYHFYFNSLLEWEYRFQYHVNTLPLFSIMTQPWNNNTRIAATISASFRMFVPSVS